MKRDSSQTRILAVSDYDGLRRSREQVLRLEGFQVESVSSQASFEAAWVRTFDIAVLCQSVEPRDAAKIAKALRLANRGITIVRINSLPVEAASPSLFDYEMDAFAGPQGILKAMEAIGHRPRAQSGRGPF
ncbi:hypothetical protein DYQ86_20460 [Acidobacteria bacterium AB60]|nr:hypothetical protein DYQ86_20460 [Acidobacteria bacterium AB60]